MGISQASQVKRCKIDRSVENMIPKELEVKLKYFLREGIIGNYHCPFAKLYYDEYNDNLRRKSEEKPILMVIDDSDEVYYRTTKKIEKSFRISKVSSLEEAVGQAESVEVDFLVVKLPLESGDTGMEIHRRLKSINQGMGVLFTLDELEVEEGVRDLVDTHYDWWNYLTGSKEFEDAVTRMFNLYGHASKSLAGNTWDLWNIRQEIARASSPKEIRAFKEIHPDLKKVFKGIPEGRETGKMVVDSDQSASGGFSSYFVLPDRQYPEEMGQILLVGEYKC